MMEAGPGLLVLAEWALWCLAAFVTAGALVPFVRSGQWWIRVWDFPRLQLGAMSVLVAGGLLGLALAGRPSVPTVALGALALLAGLWQLHFVMRYLPGWPKQVSSDTAAPDLTLLISNVEVSNSRKNEVLERLSREDVDVLLLIEVDGAWANALSSLRERFPHRIEAVAPGGLGMALWSKLPLLDGEVKHLLSERRPSIHTHVELPNGRRVRFAGVHPTPPALPKPDRDGERYDSRIRDAELTKIGRMAASDPRSPWIVAGDFNDVAWSHTTRLFEDVSGLRDPRVGRVLLNTYHAQRPLLRYPLDHVFLSPGFRVRTIRRLRAPGSDHFAVYAELTLPEIREQEPQADGDEQQEAAEIEQTGERDAREEGEASSRL